MAEVIEVIDPSEFPEQFEKLCKTEEYFLCIFTGGVNPLTGKSWCSDCDLHKPAIEGVLLKNTQFKVLKCFVASRDVYYPLFTLFSWVGVATHPYRTNPVLKVRGVPTILLIREVISFGNKNDIGRNCDESRRRRALLE